MSEDLKELEIVRSQIENIKAEQVKLKYRYDMANAELSKLKQEMHDKYGVETIEQASVKLSLLQKAFNAALDDVKNKLIAIEGSSAV